MKHMKAYILSFIVCANAHLCFGDEKLPGPLLDGLGVVLIVDQPEVPARKARLLLVEKEPQHLGVFLELVLADLDRRKADAVGGELDLVPAGADPALSAATGKVIDRGERFGQHTWMAVSDAEHQARDADTRGLDRQCGHRRDRFEAIAIASLRWCFLKVIRDREPIEATLVGEPPELSHLGEWPPEMPEMDPEPNTRSPSTDHPKASAWPAPDCWYRGPAPQA